MIFLYDTPELEEACMTVEESRFPLELMWMLMDFSKTAGSDEGMVSDRGNVELARQLLSLSEIAPEISLLLNTCPVIIDPNDDTGLPALKLLPRQTNNLC